MSYNKTIWEDSPSTKTPINAENLNKIEDALETIFNILGADFISLGRTEGTTIGHNSIVAGIGNIMATKTGAVAFGNGTSASGDFALAKGINTVANNYGASAEGNGTQAWGQFSHTEGINSFVGSNATCGHAEGIQTRCEGAYCHSEGRNTKAKGNSSHAEGYYTIASGAHQHVSGEYNVEDTNNKYAEIVGGGSGESQRKNIRTLDWNGNAEYAGVVKAKNIPDVPTEQGTYVLKAKVEIDATTYEWVLEE